MEFPNVLNAENFPHLIPLIVGFFCREMMLGDDDSGESKKVMQREGEREIDR